MKIKAEDIKVTYKKVEPMPVTIDYEGEPMTLRGDTAFWFRWMSWCYSESRARELLAPTLAAQHRAHMEAIQKVVTAAKQITTPTL